MIDHAIAIICSHKEVHLWRGLGICESIFHLSLQHVLAHPPLSSCLLLVERLLRDDFSMSPFILLDSLSCSRCVDNASPLIRCNHPKIWCRLSHIVALAADPYQPGFGWEFIFIKDSACLPLLFELKLHLLSAPIHLSLSECNTYLLFRTRRLIPRGGKIDFILVLLRGQKELDLANVARYVAREILPEFRMLWGIRVVMLGTSPRVILDFKNLNLPELCSDGNQTVVLLYVVHVDVEDVWIKFALACREEVLRCIIHFDGVATWAIRFQIDFIDVQLGIVAWHDQVVIVVELKLCESKAKVIT